MAGSSYRRSEIRVLPAMALFATEHRLLIG